MAAHVRVPFGQTKHTRDETAVSSGCKTDAKRMTHPCPSVAPARIVLFDALGEVLDLGRRRPHAALAEENAQRLAGHASFKTTRLYDRREEAVTLQEIERIRV